MRGRDPLTLAVVAMSVYALLVGVAVVVALRSSPGAVAGDLAGGDGAAVTVRPSAEPAEVVVESGMSASQIVEALIAKRVIADERQFNLLLEYTGAGAELRAGRYEFQQGTPAAEVIRRLREGVTNERVVTIPEGLLLGQIGELLERQGIATAAEWEAAISGPRPEAILAERPEGASLLGYLLPATYPLTSETTAEDLVAAMIAALAGQLTDDLLADMEASGRSLHEVLTLASIVEKEAVVADEQPLIASALLNRLALGVALQADPTVQFAISRERPARGWWPQIFEDDLKIDSLYNTYRYPGLPPGPIANPGIGAITAVLHPADTDYLYFVARCDGSERHDFATTLEDHNVNVARCHAP